MRTIIVLTALVAASPALCQDRAQQARDMGLEAIRLMDQGATAEAIVLLRKAWKLDPASHIYPYEIGFAYMLRKEYPASIKHFKLATRAKDATDQCHQMLGNVLDISGQPKQADAVYDAGLRAFPRSGRLYMEKGVMAMGREDYTAALDLFDKGIAVEPAYPTNYHRAAKLYLSSSEAVWGMLYAEILMNIERNSERTREMSALLHKAYRERITFPTDSTARVDFSRQNVIDISALRPDGKPKLPFPLIAYEPTLLVAILDERTIDLASLHRIRSRFVDFWFGGDLPVRYPNALFDYQREVRDAGHLEAYNHWVLMMGDGEAFEAWETANPEKWTAFVEWFKANPMRVTPENHFRRSQY